MGRLGYWHMSTPLGKTLVIKVRNSYYHVFLGQVVTENKVFISPQSFNYLFCAQVICTNFFHNLFASLAIHFNIWRTCQKNNNSDEIENSSWHEFLSLLVKANIKKVSHNNDFFILIISWYSKRKYSNLHFSICCLYQKIL